MYLGDLDSPHHLGGHLVGLLEVVSCSHGGGRSARRGAPDAEADSFRTGRGEVEGDSKGGLPLMRGMELETACRHKSRCSRHGGQERAGQAGVEAGVDSGMKGSFARLVVGHTTSRRQLRPQAKLGGWRPAAVSRCSGLIGAGGPVRSTIGFRRRRRAASPPTSLQDEADGWPRHDLAGKCIAGCILLIAAGERYSICEPCQRSRGDIHKVASLYHPNRHSTPRGQARDRISISTLTTARCSEIFPWPIQSHPRRRPRFTSSDRSELEVGTSVRGGGTRHALYRLRRHHSPAEPASPPASSLPAAPYTGTTAMKCGKSTQFQPGPGAGAAGF
nr:hypothetical protein CFP56_38928 [Quercus suber]